MACCNCVFTWLRSWGLFSDGYEELKDDKSTDFSSDSSADSSVLDDNYSQRSRRDSGRKGKASPSYLRTSQSARRDRRRPQVEGIRRRTVPATSDLRAHVERLLTAKGTIPGQNGFDAEFMQLERIQAQKYKPEDFSCARTALNSRKNRYTDILPHDQTRVKLKVADGDASDYVNANFVDSPLAAAATHRYISTQGPLESTFADFWRMVWEQNSRIIVMLTKEIEKGYLKCDRYWPNARGVARRYGNILVEPVALLRDSTGTVTIRHFRVARSPLRRQLRRSSTGSDDDINLDMGRSRALNNNSHFNNNNNNEDDEDDNAPLVWRTVTHYQYTGWPDHGVPSSSEPFLRLLRDVSRRELDLIKHEKQFASYDQLPPIIVHCSAGIGRSGTFICVHSTLEGYINSLVQQAPIAFDIVTTIERMREQRYGMVQTREQFTFCYLATLESIESPEFANNISVDADADTILEVLACMRLGDAPSTSPPPRSGEGFEAEEEEEDDDSDDDDSEDFDDDDLYDD